MTQQALLVKKSKTIQTSQYINLLSSLGFAISEVATDANTVEQILQQKRFTLVIVLNQHDLDLAGLCREMRQADPSTIVIVISDRYSEDEHIMSLQLGATDYLAWNISLTELKVRISAHIQRTDFLTHNCYQQRCPEKIVHNGLVIDKNTHSVQLHGNLVELTAKEFDLLNVLASRPGQVFTREQLLNQVWGAESDHYQHTVSTHINRLRTKLENMCQQYRYIHTVWGIGYKFSEVAA